MKPLEPSSETQIHDENDGREPYEPPKLESDELFETLALACGKVQPVTFNCQRVNKKS
jgi:hypothetical protein